MDNFKKIGVFLCFLIALNSAVFAQERYMVKAGEVSFTSDAPLELIEANTSTIQGLIQTMDRSFVFRVQMNTFEGFNSGTQKTHFNSNYLETDKFQFTSFEGKIIEEVDLTQPGTYKVRGKGRFDCHGVKQERIIRCDVIVESNKVTIETEFTVLLADHNIKIPTVVNQKIAEEIKVSISMSLIAK